MKIRNITSHALAASLLFLPLMASAQGTFVPLAPVNSGPLAQLYSSQSGGDLSNFINSLFKFTLALGAIAGVLRLAYAGYLYMGQADMWSHKGEAKKIIGDVTLGLLLLLGIYLILYQINPDIVRLNGIHQIQSNQVPLAPSSGGGTTSQTPTAPTNTGTCISYDEFGQCTGYQ